VKVAGARLVALGDPWTKPSYLTDYTTSILERPIRSKKACSRKRSRPDLSDQVIESIVSFALENRCKFACGTPGLNVPAIVKDDIC
jgi:hypothetical protein